MKKGLVHIYIGDGKGKTTAAVGLGVRAAGSGMRVHFVQFLKDGNSNELSSLKLLNNFSIGDAPKNLPFYFQMKTDEKEQYKEYAVRLFCQAKELAKTGKAQLIICDEILDAVSLDIIKENDLAALLNERADGVEVVLTGREAGLQILNQADYVSKIIKEKHPYDKGVAARNGIEF